MKKFSKVLVKIYKRKFIYIFSCMIILCYFSGCAKAVKHLIPSSASAQPMFADTSNQLFHLRYQLSGIWKVNKFPIQFGADDEFSWGTSKMDSSSVAIDLLANPATIWTPSGQLIIKTVTPDLKDKMKVNLTIIGNGNSYKEEVTINIQTDGSIIFQGNESKSMLAVSFKLNYYKVDGPSEP